MVVKKFFYYLFLCIFLCNFSSHQLSAIIIGSNTAIARQARVTFPAIDPNNEIRGFTFMEKGFALQDMTTSCSFNALFPVSGDISLNGGTLYLLQDMALSGVVTFTNLGHLSANSAALIDLAPSMDRIGSGSVVTYTWTNINVQMNSNIQLNANIMFKGASTIDGGGHALDFSSAANLWVAPSSTLTLKNVVVKGISQQQIRCLTSSSNLILDEVTWIQDGDSVFDMGSILFRNVNMISGADTIFVYSTDQVSTITTNGKLILDNGLTFSYDPSINSQTLLQFTDDTASLVLQGATLHVTVTGLTLTKGQLEVTQHSAILSETEPFGEGSVVDNGITWGNDLASDDLKVTIYSSINLSLLRGSLNYRNVLDTSFSMGNVDSKIIMAPVTSIKLYETLDLGIGFLVLGDSTIIGRATGKDLIGSVNPLGTYFYISL